MEGMRPKIEKLKSELEVIRKERNDSPEMLSDTEEHDNEWADKFGDLSGSQILAQCEGNNYLLSSVASLVFLSVAWF